MFSLLLKELMFYFYIHIVYVIIRRMQYAVDLIRLRHLVENFVTYVKFANIFPE